MIYIYILSGIVSLAVTLLVIVRICETAKNTEAILDLLKKQFEKQDEAPAAMPNVSATNEDGTEKTIFQMRQEQERQIEKSHEDEILEYYNQ